MHISEIAARIPARDAQLAVARVLAVLGSEFDWNSATLDDIVTAISPAIPTGLPSCFDQSDDDISFWRGVSE